MGLALNILLVVGVVVVVALGGGLVWGIGHAAGWGKSGNKTLKSAQKKALPNSFIDLEGDISQAEVQRIAQRYVGDSALDATARGVLDTFTKADLTKQSILSLMNQEFEKGSLTWDKFNVPVELAFEGITRNAAQIVNRMQAFDSAEYSRMDRIDQAGGYDDESNEVARLKVMRNALGEMRAIQNKNNQLLLELERLESELSNLTGNDTDQIVEEIQQLADDAKYYS